MEGPGGGTGARSLVATAYAAGVRLCLANPGTTELALVAALAAEPAVHSVLCLAEGVATGAADGYARMAGAPAMALLHLGPGLANGWSMLHDARRAGTPVLAVVGDHASWHLPYDPPLASDLATLAATVGWVRTTTGPDDVGPATAAALAAACSGRGGVATLVVPADHQAGPVPAGREAALAAPRARTPVDDGTVTAAAEALRAAGARGDAPAVLLLGGPALHEPGLRTAARVAAATGCRLMAEGFPARVERGGGRPVLERLPYFPEAVLEALSAPLLVTAGTGVPVAFFGYPGTPSVLLPDGTAHQPLAGPADDVLDALERLAERLGAPATAPAAAGPQPPDGLPSGTLDPAKAAAVLAALQPEGAVVVDEGLTSSGPYWPAAAGAPPFTLLAHTGGAIGQGLPLATGAALAAPDRAVIDLQADGSAAYTLQALWTQARESLDVTTLICANRSYRILQLELARAGASGASSGAARTFTELTEPAPSWVRLAEGFGVPARQAATAEELDQALRAALAEPGPHLVELLL